MSQPDASTIIRRLRELRYTEPLPLDAVPLVDRLLGDLLKSVNSFHVLREKHEELTKELAVKDVKLDDLVWKVDAKDKENCSISNALRALEEENATLKELTKVQPKEAPLTNAYSLSGLEETDKSARRRVESRCEELEKEVDALTTTLEDITRAHTSLKDYHATLELKYNQSIEKEQTLTRHLDALKSDRQDISTSRVQDLSRVQTDNRDLYLKLEEAQKRNTDLQNDLEKEIDKRQHDNEVFQLRLTAALRGESEDKLEKMNSELNLEIKRIQGDLAHANAEKMNLKTQLTLKTTELERFQDELREARLKEHSVNLDAKSTRKQTHELAGQVTDLRQSLHDLADQKGSIQAFLEDRLVVLGEKESEIQQLSFELSAVRGDLDGQQLLVKELKRDLDHEREIKSRMDEEMVQAKTREIELRRTEGELKRDIQKMEQKINILESEKKDIQIECENWISRLKDAKREKANLEETVEKSMRQELNKESDLARLANETKKTQNQLELENTGLSIELSKERSTVNDLRTELADRNKELLAISETRDKEILELQKEVVAMAKQNQALNSEITSSRTGADSTLGDLRKAENQIRSIREERQQDLEKIAALEAELSEMRGAAQDLATTKNESLQKIRTQQQEALQMRAQLDTLREDIRKAELKKETVSASEQHLLVLNTEQHDANVKLKQRVTDLETEKSQLTLLMQSLESTRLQLVEQLQNQQDVLSKERERTENALKDQLSSTKGVAEATSQNYALQEALKAIDRERDDIRNVADMKTTENAVLQLQIAEGDTARRQLEITLEDTRRNHDISLAQLTDRENQIQEQSTLILQLRQDMDELRDDLHKDKRSLAVHQEDLSVMTRENGSLNEQILILARERDVLISEKNELKALVEKNLQQIAVMELERDDLVQLYKETFEESARRESTVKALEFEREEGLKKISDYTMRNQTLSAAEDKAVSEARQQEMNVRTLKQQVSDLVYRLEENTKQLEENARTHRELEQDLFLAGQASKDIEQRRYNLERDLVAARADLDKSISETAKLTNDLQQEKQITKMERMRNQRLEELLAEHRRATLELEVSTVSRNSNINNLNPLDKSNLDGTIGQNSTCLPNSSGTATNNNESSSFINMSNAMKQSVDPGYQQQDIQEQSSF